MRYKLLLLFLAILALTTTAQAQKGLFVRFSLGPSYMIEDSGINESGLTLPTKNYALGWGLNDQYAVFISYVARDHRVPGITLCRNHGDE
ncbi:MAG: hypothetical protein V2A56_11605 [bacterium]